MSIARHIWVVEERGTISWYMRVLAFETRDHARGHVAGLVKNAGYSRRDLRIVKFNRARKRTNAARNK
jgi:hypothetical protein